MPRLLTLALMVCCAALMTSAPARAGKPHQHGVATLDVAMDGAEVTLELTVPLEALLGFERAPQTDNERRLADELLSWMRQGQQVFSLESTGPCTFMQAVLKSPVLEQALHRQAPGSSGLSGPRGTEPTSGSNKSPPKAASSKAEQHADLVATYVFACAMTEPPQKLRTLLFSSFRRLDRVQVQAALPQGQFKGVLRRGADTMSFSRTESAKPKRAQP